MTLDSKLREIRRFCRDHADEARVRKYARFFVEGYDAYGLDQQTMEKQRDQWLRAWEPELGLDGLLGLGERLIGSGKYEEASFAVWFAIALKDRFTAATVDRLGRWLETGICNWAHTDVFSGQVLAVLLQRKIVPMDDWRTSKSKWMRRAVPVSLIEPVKRGLPAAGLLKFIAPMMLDPEKVVQQGLGWLLRETWKLHPEPVEKLLLNCKDTCPRLIVQYATEKMTPAQKAKFKKSSPTPKPSPKRKRNPRR
jgi:3-methyladenine DNA glycosylase AlkD